MRIGIDIRFVIHKEEYIASYLSSRGHRYDVLDGCKAIRKSTESYLDYIYTGIKAVPKIIRYIRENDIKIVHTNGKDMHRTWAVPARMAKIRHIWHERGKFNMNMLDRKVASCSDVIIPISDYSYKAIPPALLARSRRVNNPIYVNHPDKSEIDKIRKDILQNQEGKIVGIFSRLERPRKRIGLFVNIAKKLIMKYGENIHFLICGRGEEETIANIVKEAGPYRHQFHIKGLVHPVEPWMAASDCIVAPAIAEPLGRTPLEASALDIPVVAARDGGHIETVIDGVTGFLVQPDNVDEFSEKIILVLNGATCGRESKIARDHLLEKYNPQLNAEILKNIYLDLLQR